MRTVPVKNYFIAFLIMILTILLTLLLASIYLDNKNLNDKKYLSTLSEIKVDELDNFLVEAHDIMLYISDSENSNKILDRKFERIINKDNHNQDVVYLDLYEIDESFYDKFSKKYNVSSNDIKSNTIIFIKDGNLNKIINLNETNIKLIDKYIESYYGD